MAIADEFKTLIKNPWVTGLFTLFVVVYVLYLIIKKYKAILKEQEFEPIYIRKPQNAKKPMEYSNTKIPLPKDGTGYSMSCWLYINDWDYNYGEWKHILHKGDAEGHITQPGIYLHPTKNKLIVRFDRKYRPQNYEFRENHIKPSCMSLQTGTKPHFVMKSLGEMKESCTQDPNCNAVCAIGIEAQEGVSDKSLVAIGQVADRLDDDIIDFAKTAEDTPPLPPGVKAGTFIKTEERASMNPRDNIDMITDKTLSNDVDNVPLGRWFHLVVVVKLQSTEIFVDGLLRQVTTLDAPMKQNSGKLYVTQDGGFSGLITQLRYYDTPLSHHRINDIFKWGPDPWLWPDLIGLAADIAGSVKIDVKVKGDFGSMGKLNVDTKRGKYGARVGGRKNYIKAGSGV